MTSFPRTLTVRYTQKQLFPLYFLLASSVTRSGDSRKILESRIITSDTSLVSPTSFPAQLVMIVMKAREDFLWDVAIREEKKGEEDEESTMDRGETGSSCAVIRRRSCRSNGEGQVVLVLLVHWISILILSEHGHPSRELLSINSML